jgi:uncharacterized OB-fold protein
MISSIPIMWRLKNQRYQMVGSACPDCGEVAFPPREVCPHCAANDDLLFPTNLEKTPEEILTEAYLVEAHA